MSQRTLSDETRRLLAELGQPASSIGRLLRLADSPASVVERVGAAGEPAALRYLLPYVFDKRRSVARAAATAVASLLSAVPASELPWLDERLREYSIWWGEWFDMEPQDLKALARFDDAHPSLLRLATCHPSGYVREAALKSLASSVDGSELPFLLLRLNDWVAPVRACALDLVRQRVSPAAARSLVRALPLVVRLGDLGRADHSAAVEMIHGVLRHPDSLVALREGNGSADRKIRRLTYRLTADNPGADVGALVRAALQDEDPLVRLWAARLVVETFEEGKLPAVLEVLERDPFMAIRRHALDVRLEHLTDTAESKLVEFLLDPSVAVRGHCHYYLGKRFQRDPAVEYRERLAGETHRLRACLAGLGEVGEAADSKSVEPFLDDPRASIRAAAIRSLARLSKDPPIERLLQALQDPSGGVSREAREALRRCAQGVGPDALKSIYTQAQDRHVRRNALWVVARSGLWDSLPILVSAACDSDERLRELGHVHLRRWLIRSNRGQFVPHQDQLRLARESLDACSKAMPVALWTELDFVVRTAQTRP